MLACMHMKPRLSTIPRSAKRRSLCVQDEGAQTVWKQQHGHIEIDRCRRRADDTSATSKLQGGAQANPPRIRVRRWRAQPLTAPRIQFVAMRRPKGMYESMYHPMARNCTTPAGATGVSSSARQLCPRQRARVALGRATSFVCDAGRAGVAGRAADCACARRRASGPGGATDPP